ncbi:hypothetical protein G6F61_014780 [Rhizopus arrhizus]|nr:hypothetical protein G6F61_014780 [Rhizopus arrhizus]
MSILDERAQLTLGVRQQRIESRNFNAPTGVRTVSYDESATTPLAGLVINQAVAPGLTPARSGCNACRCTPGAS